MNTLPIRAAMNAPQRMALDTSTAAAVPTSTGAIAAGSVRGRAAMSHNLISRRLLRYRVRGGGVCGACSRTFGELGEIGAATLGVRVASLLALLAHVEEQRRVVGELL